MNRIKETIRNIFMIPELRRRILLTFALLAIFRLGAFIPLPGINVEELRKIMKDMRDVQLFGFLRVFSGGALEKMSLFALGIMPYISASIIMQLLVKVIPRLEALSKEGPSGHRKISQYTRLATLPICLIQGMFIIRFLRSHAKLVNDPTFLGFDLSAIFALTAGTIFVMWLSEQISEYGLGNGASIIIMAGIVADMPGALTDFWVNREDFGMDKLLFLAFLFVAMVAVVVVVTQAQRRIAVQHAKHTRGRRVYGGARHYLPLRVNQAGVMPVIFASSLMVVPITLEGWVLGGADLVFAGHGFWYSVVFVGLVVFFSYFWTALFFQPAEMADQLKEHGSFVPGIRPGKNTADYLEKVMNRVTLAGAAFIAGIALMPDLVSYHVGVARYISRFMGGTGILIVVGVGLDMMQKVESHLVMRQYEGFLKKGRIHGRRG